MWCTQTTAHWLFKLNTSRLLRNIGRSSTLIFNLKLRRNLSSYSLNIGLVPHRYVSVHSVWVLDFVFVGKHDRPTAVKGPETEPGVQREKHLGHEDNKMDFFSFSFGFFLGGEGEGGGWVVTGECKDFTNKSPARGKREKTNKFSYYNEYTRQVRSACVDLHLHSCDHSFTNPPADRTKMILDCEILYT